MSTAVDISPSYPELGGLSLSEYRAMWITSRDVHPVAVLAERTRLQEAAAGDGLFSWVIADLYAAWSRASLRTYRVSPDALRHHSPVESERFWARTVPGPEGHLYWTGPKLFRRNGGSEIVPRRWIWVRKHGSISKETDVWPECAETNCLALDHLASGRLSRHRRYDRERALARLRVVALAHGGSISQTSWEQLKAPGDAGVAALFSLVGKRGWPNVLKAAGLPQPTGSRFPEVTRFQCERALVGLAERIGRTPTLGDFAENKAWLKSLDHPSSHTTIVKRMEVRTWAEACRKAGLR